MKVLTVQQPWATLIAAGVKPYEFRKWTTDYRGPLLIHAAKKLDWEAFRDPWVLKHLKRLGVVECHKADPADDFEEPMVFILGEKMPRSAILCGAFLERIIDLGQLGIPHDLKKLLQAQDWNTAELAGHFAWKLERVYKLKAPIPSSGALGLWDPPAGLDIEVRDMPEEEQP